MLLRRAALGLLLLTGTACPSWARWSEAKSKHFVIYSEQSPSDLKNYAERLERFDAMVRRIRGMHDPTLTDGAKVTIYVLPSVAAVQNLHGGSRKDRVLGFYSPRASGSVAFVTNRLDERRNGLSSQHVFQHEYLHHLMLTDTKTPVAPWMIEGYAEFFGTSEISKDGTIKLGLPPQARGYGVLNDLGFNAEQLLANKIARSDEDRSSLYGKGWLLTHYLAFNDARRAQLPQYLDALAKGEPALAAARSAFGDLKVLDRELDRYARGTFRVAVVSPGPTPIVSVRPLSDAEDAIMAVRIRVDRGTRPETAGAVAADARRIAAGHPNNPFVQATLAESEFDAKNYKAAAAAADRALAADPANVQAMIYKARSLMEEGRSDPAKADWAGIRRLLGRANRADLENAEPLHLFYQTYLMAGEKPTANAIEGLYYAFALAPNDRRLRFTTVRQMLLDNKPAAAEPLLATILFDPHLSEAVRPMLTAVMDRIKARDATGALAALRPPESNSAEGAS